MHFIINMKFFAQIQNMIELEHAHATQFVVWQLKLNNESVNQNFTMINLFKNIKFSLFFFINIQIIKTLLVKIWRIDRWFYWYD